jgi:GxxExxY protein
LEVAIRNRKLRIRRQRKLPVGYKGVLLPIPLRLDLAVEDPVIVEVKAALDHYLVFESQVLTYLRISGSRLGPLVIFGFPIVGRGISRVVNGLIE